METAPYVEANLERAVTVRELADVAELSTHHSKDLLRSRRASLAEVSLCTGLGSQSHFTSVFRRAVGATPAEFQRLKAKTI
jgi:AraC family transcriptional regulator